MVVGNSVTWLLLCPFFEVIRHPVAITCYDQFCTKSEMPSFIHSKNIEGCQKLKGSSGPNHTPLPVYISQVVLIMANLCIKFGMPIFTHFKDVDGMVKIKSI